MKNNSVNCHLRIINANFLMEEKISSSSICLTKWPTLMKYQGWVGKYRNPENKLLGHPHWYWTWHRSGHNSRGRPICIPIRIQNRFRLLTRLDCIQRSADSPLPLDNKQTIGSHVITLIPSISFIRSESKPPSFRIGQRSFHSSVGQQIRAGEIFLCINNNGPFLSLN